MAAVPPRRLPRAVREQQMLDAAVRVFSRQGFHATSVDQIAEAAGISKPMVYAYLGSKEELFTACLRREGARLMQALADAAAAAAGTELGIDDRLWRALRAFLRFVADHRDGWGVLYRQARGQEPFARVLADLRAQMVEVVEGMFATGAVPAADVGMAAQVLVGAAESVADWLVDHPDEDPDRAAERLMNVTWLGLRAALRGEHRPTRLPP